MPDRAGGKEVNGGRPPDQRRAHRRQQRQKGHHHAPEHGPLDAKEPKDQPAQRALHGGDGDVALDGGADHGGELGGQLALVHRVQRHRVAHAGGQRAAVAQQEEQQVQHHAETHHELQRVGAEIHRLGRQELAGLGTELRQARLQLGHRRQVEVVQHLHRPIWQGLDDGLQVAADIDLARFEMFIDDAGLGHQGGDDHQQRQNHQQQTDAQGDQRRQVLAAWHALQ
ncbi:hypothetical protein SDC9_112384 [bioreactor metagenome]|uniref:Uncharacterized protein n=1 Tax=bioreactor metagenome TaxID=1076179 RepID=A0A645BJF7_9ZZZZ